MQTRNADYRSAVAAIFLQPGFIRDLGAELVDCGPGWCTTRLALAPRHLQHTGVVHAGVSATLADHTAGAACLTLYGAGALPVTVEFGIRLLRAARGTHLECRGEVVKAGRLTAAEASIHAIDGEARILVAKLTSTLFAVDGSAKIAHRILEGHPMPAPLTFETYRDAALAAGFDEVIERHWAADLVVDEHAHPFAARALVVRGEMWLTVGDDTQHLLVGDTFRLARGCPHRERYGSDGATYWVARRSTEQHDH